MTRLQFLRSVAAVALIALAPVSLYAQEADGAAFVSTFAQKGINDTLTAKIANAEKQQRFRDMFKIYFDIPGIGRFVLARFAKAATPAELEKFNILFEDVIVYTWSRRFSEYNGQTLKVTGQQADGGEGTLVKSTILGNASGSFGVDWRLRKRPEGFKVLDIIVEGVSMAITYRQDYSTVISQSGSFAGLLAQMEKQVADLKAQQGA